MDGLESDGLAIFICHSCSVAGVVSEAVFDTYDNPERMLALVASILLPEFPSYGSMLTKQRQVKEQTMRWETVGQTGHSARRTEGFLPEICKNDTKTESNEKQQGRAGSPIVRIIVAFARI